MIPAKWCANGEECVCAPALGGPVGLSRSNVGRICYACRERRIDEQLVPPSEGDRLLRVDEAAAWLGANRKHIEYLIASAQLRTRKEEGRLLIAEDDLQRLASAKAKLEAS